MAVIKNPVSGKYEAKADGPDDLSMAILAAGAAVKQADSGAGTATSDLLNQLLLDELGQRQKKRAEAEEEIRRLMLARTQGFKGDSERRRREQASCQHRKDDGRVAIGGQKLSNNSYSFICSRCFSEFTEHTLPAGVQVNLDTIGG